MSTSSTAYLTRDDLRILRKRSDWRGAWMVAHAWSLIAGSTALFAFFPNPLTFLLAVMIIGARQLGLAVLMHDAAHGLLFHNRRLNDWVGQRLCAYPVIADLALYRPYHFEHHKKTQQPDDPDLHLSAKFPVTRASLWRKTVRDLTGQTFWKQHVAIGNAALGGPSLRSGEKVSNFFTLLRGPFITNLVLLAGMSALGKPHYYLMFWLLPAATWRMWVTRLRNIAEHAVVSDNNDVLKNARTTITGPLERLFIAPYFVNYHLEHHLYMWIPCYNLPAAHAHMREHGFLPRMEVQKGYRDVLRRASSKPALA